MCKAVSDFMKICGQSSDAFAIFNIFAIFDDFTVLEAFAIFEALRFLKRAYRLIMLQFIDCPNEIQWHKSEKKKFIGSKYRKNV